MQSDAYATLRDKLVARRRRDRSSPTRRAARRAVGPVELEQEARDLVHRGLADALVVNRSRQRRATPLGDVKRVRDAVGAVPLLVGSGVTPETVRETLALADAVIVGTSLKQHGDVRKPVDPARVQKLVAAARAT